MEDPIRVLVVDDEPALRHGIEGVLQVRGMLVTTADCGPTAIQLLDADAPDVMLVDCIMPGMDGLSVLERVKEIRPDVEVIMMTALADVEMAVSAMRAGAYDVLKKPLESNDGLALSVTAAAEHHRLFAGSVDVPSSLLEMPYAEAKRRMLALFDESYVASVMHRAGGNTSEAARQAGLDRSNFRRIARKTREG